MQQGASKKNTVIVAVVVLALVGAAYFFFTRDREPDAGILTSIPVSIADSDELVGALNQLKSLTLDESIFSDPVFRSLEDSNVVLTEIRPGRANPFAPFSAAEIFQASQFTSDPTPLFPSVSTTTSATPGL